MSLFLHSHIASAQWQWVNPLPTGNTVSAMTWDGSRFIGFDSSDTVLTSVDAGTWSSTPTDQFDFITTIVRGNGTYVAAGLGFGGAMVITSPDGLTWTAHDSGVPVSRFSQALWNPDLQQFVLIADSGVILTSADGISWAPQGSGTVNDLNGITWANGKYVVVGAHGTVLTSSNGVDWTDHSIPTTDDTLLSVAAHGNLFALVSSAQSTSDHSAILTNPDPTDPAGWQLAFGVVDPTAHSQLTRIVWDGSAFVAVGGIIASSSDGVVWTFVSSGLTDTLTTVAFSDSQIVAADFSGDILVSSLDGLAWTRTSNNVISERLTSVIWTGNQFAAVSEFGSFISSDNNGLDWQVNNFAMPFSANALAYGAGTFVAVGEGGIASSSDGFSFDPSPATGLTQVIFRSVAWGAGRFVAVGTINVGKPPLALPLGVVFTSTDGGNWTSQPSGALPGDSYLSVIWAGDQFLAVGASVSHSADGDLNLGPPPVFTSPDGLSWTRSSPLNSVIGGTALVSVAWSGKQFVAVGTPGFLFDSRSIATSADGVQWNYVNPLPSPPISAGALESVIWTGSRFVTVGAATSELTSPDGLTWTAHSTGANDLSGVASSGTRCIAVGDLGAIMREDSLCNNDPIFKAGFE